MYGYFVFICVVVSFTQGQLLTSAQVPCSTSYDCGPTECCVSNNQPRGKRAAAVEHHGFCHSNGTTGDQCFVTEMSTGVFGLYYDCPCSAGFSCRGTGMTEVPKGEVGVCEPHQSLSIASTLGRSCSSGADCADTECCLSSMRPIGKRAASGTCTTMGTDGSSCLVKMGSGKPADTVYSCPCLSNFTCHGLGLFDVPLGEMGTCQL